MRLAIRAKLRLVYFKQCESLLEDDDLEAFCVGLDIKSVDAHDITATAANGGATQLCAERPAEDGAPQTFTDDTQGQDGRSPLA